MLDVLGDLLAAIQQQRAGRLDAAEELYRRVLDAYPEHPQALFLYGLLLVERGRAGEALDPLGAAVAARPDHTGARAALARALLTCRRASEALAQCDALVALAPRAPDAHFLRGTALNALGQPGPARIALQQAVALDPDVAAAWLNLGNACADIDRLEEAEAHCRRALALAPDLAEAHASLGFILGSMGRTREAIDACEAAIALQPEFAQAHWNQAVAALLAGDFGLGLQQYEWRKRHDRFRRDFLELPGPQFRGGDVAGRTVLVQAEQGLGDTIQFARYAKLLAERGARVVLACHPSLIPLLRQLPGVEAVARGGALPQYDCWIDQMSLPLAFGTRLESVPLAEGYLAADAERAQIHFARLRERSASERSPGEGATALLVGIAWAGNPLHSNDRRRSLPVEALRPLLATRGIEFVSLQTGERAAEAGLRDWSPLLTDFAQTAALIAALDLVVTVDTAVAHLAGALGKPCWILLPYAPDWRWMLRRPDSPWYASVRLFRQARPGEWEPVMARVADELIRWRARSSTGPETTSGAQP